jgi:acyl-CoA hydrolase
MDYNQLYSFKKRGLPECLDKIKSNDFVILGAATAAPNETLRNLHTIADRVENVTVFSGLEGSFPFQTTEGISGHIASSGVFFGPGLRAGYKLGNSTYCPGNLHDALVRRMEYRKPNVSFAARAPMDERGYFRCLSACGRKRSHEAG